jgi:hypothetical protein
MLLTVVSFKSEVCMGMQAKIDIVTTLDSQFSLIMAWFCSYPGKDADTHCITACYHRLPAQIIWSTRSLKSMDVLEGVTGLD